MLDDPQIKNESFELLSEKAMFSRILIEVISWTMYWGLRFVGIH